MFYHSEQRKEGFQKQFRRVNSIKEQFFKKRKSRRLVGKAVSAQMNLTALLPTPEKK
jgi:hypothetical protein